jgi:hypothetical protein
VKADAAKASTAQKDVPDLARKQFYQPLTVNLPPIGKSSAQASGLSSYAAVASAPPTQSRGNMQASGKVRKPSVIGTKVVADGASSSLLKSSSLPRPFHLYVGNLDVNSTSEQVEDSLASQSVRVLSCNIVRSTRFEDLRSVAAHVVVDARDKDRAFNADIWPADSRVRPWRQSRPRRRKVSYGAWGDDDDVID